MDYINKNALFKEMIKRYGKNYTYAKISTAIDGKTGILSEKEKKQLLAVIKDIAKEVEENILKS